MELLIKLVLSLLSVIMSLEMNKMEKSLFLIIKKLKSLLKAKIKNFWKKFFQNLKTKIMITV